MRPVLVAACISEIDVRRLDSRLQALKRDIVGWDHTKELKGASLLKRRKLARSPKLVEFVGELIELIAGFPLEIVGVVMEHPTLPPPRREDFLPLPHRDLVERIHALVRDRAKSSATILFDGENRKLARAYASYLYRTPQGQEFSAITDAPYFVDSAITPGIQVADFVAYMMRAYEERHLRRAAMSQLVEDDDRLIKRGWERVRVKGPRDLKAPDGQGLYGIRRRTAAQLDDDSRGAGG